MIYKKSKGKNKDEHKFFDFIKNLFAPVWSFLSAFLKVAYILFFLGLLVFLIYYWNFDKADKVFNFLQLSFWPIVALVILFLFKNQIATLIEKGIVIMLPGGQEVRVGLPAPQQEPTQKNPEPKNIEDFKDITKPYENEISKLGEDREKLRTELLNIQIYLDFERIYRVIFGSQIELLKRLRTLSPMSEPAKDTIFFFVLNQRLFPTLVNWTFGQYMAFVLNTGLIVQNNDSYFITDRGRAFLAYIELMNFPKRDL